MKFLLNELVKPLLRRGGSLLGGFLLTIGVMAPQVDIIVTGAMALASVAIDLLLSHRNRK
ncbi:MAG: hypothetical protein JKY31_03480 [Rhodobacteraceae bacterium]|nr:hypothetical protein [Paracoccaceae bacterium]